MKRRLFYVVIAFLLAHCISLASQYGCCDTIIPIDTTFKCDSVYFKILDTATSTRHSEVSKTSQSDTLYEYANRCSDLFFGVKGGANIFSTKAVFDTICSGCIERLYTSDIGIEAMVGIFIDVNLNDYWSIRPELLYVNRGIQPAARNNTYNAQYIDFRPTVKFSIPIAQKEQDINLYLLASPTIGYATSNDQMQELETAISEDAKPYYVGGGLGLGFSIPFRFSNDCIAFNLGVEAQYRYGWILAFGQDINPFYEANRGIEVSLNIAIPFGCKTNTRTIVQQESRTDTVYVEKVITRQQCCVQREIYDRIVNRTEIVNIGKPFYIDTSMFCPRCYEVPQLIKLIENGQGICYRKICVDGYFEHDSSALLVETQKKLDEIVDLMTTQAFIDSSYHIAIFGHADSSGEGKYMGSNQTIPRDNIWLSQERADHAYNYIMNKLSSSVKQSDGELKYLQNNCIIGRYGLGKTCPADSIATKDGKNMKNRRIEFYIICDKDKANFTNLHSAKKGYTDNEIRDIIFQYQKLDAENKKLPYIMLKEPQK